MLTSKINVDRKMNFELLRIIAMLMIIALHYWGKSGFIDAATPSTPGYFLAWSIRSVCYCAVNCYVLITGYFMIGTSFKPSKLIRLWLQVFEYTIVFYFIACFMGISSFSLLGLGKCFFPITTEAYWFVTKYLLLYAISPFLNKYIESCDKKTLSNTCIVLLTVFSIIPTFLCFCDFTNIENGYSLIWFVTLYFVAAYIRLYGIKLIDCKWKCLAGLAINVIILFSVKIGLYYLTEKVLGKADFTNLLFRYNTVFVFGAAISLFGFFRNVSINNTKMKCIIGCLSPATLGVYLIHLNPSIKDWFWKEIINPMKYNNCFMLFVHFIFIVITVYVISTLIELIRLFLLENSLMNSFFNRMDRKSCSFFDIR